MYEYAPLFIPSNLGETKLCIGISPTFDKNVTESSILERHTGCNEAHHFDGYSCFMWAANVKLAQQKVIDFSHKLEQAPMQPVQSDRIYFMPLFGNISYGLFVDRNRHCDRPFTRVSRCPDKPEQPWHCKIIASNLVQLQEALFIHEKNLIQKQSQVLKQRRDGADER